ncbi:hypothetical protein WI96_19580 [Burkholderia vietnamiensis]|nr:hypothetical protein WI96_19580 [Burkholderia vietnamiensis]
MVYVLHDVDDWLRDFSTAITLTLLDVWSQANESVSVLVFGSSIVGEPVFLCAGCAMGQSDGRIRLE